MSLPSYVVNIGEFNELLSSSLKGSPGNSAKSIKVDFIENEHHIHHTDIVKKFLFDIPPNSIIYGLEIIESSFKTGNYCTLFLVDDVLGRTEKILDIPLFDGYSALSFEHPIIYRDGGTFFIDYYNESITTKRVCVRLRYLRSFL